MYTVIVNSTAGLLSALRSATAGETIALAPGTYRGVSISNARFSAPVRITSLDVTHPAVLVGLRVAGSSHLTFHHLTLSTQGLTTAAPFQVGSSQNLAFTNLTVEGSTSTWNTIEGLVVRWSSNITVSNSSFSYLWNGIQELDNSGVNISNNNFSNIRGDGIDNAGSQNVTIAGNSFTNFEPSGSEHPDAIQFWTTNTTKSSENVVIENNVITRGTGKTIQGIFLGDSVGNLPFVNLKILNNTVTGEIYNAIAVGHASGVTVSGNKVTAYTDQQSWIWINHTSQLSLENNEAPRYVLQYDTGVTSLGDKILAAIAPGLSSTGASSSTSTSSSTAFVAAASMMSSSTSSGASSTSAASSGSTQALASPTG